MWVDESGQARAYVHVPGGLTAEGFVANLKDGHAYESWLGKSEQGR